MNEENKLPIPKREAVTLAPRQAQVTNKPMEQVIAEAPLKTNLAEQTNPKPEVLTLEQTKPWMVGQKLSEAELTNVTKIKTFQIPALLQAKMDTYVELRQKQSRGVGQKKISDTSVILESLERFLNSELKKQGFDTKIVED